MKNIKQILLIVILVIFTVACTNENDIESAYNNSNRLKTNIINGGYEREYYQYDPKEAA